MGHNLGQQVLCNVYSEVYAAHAKWIVNFALAKTVLCCSCYIVVVAVGKGNAVVVFKTERTHVILTDIFRWKIYAKLNNINTRMYLTHCTRCVRVH